MYKRYLSVHGGKYYIHLNKNTGELYQLHAESNQFKDASDKEINRDEFAKENPQLKSFYDKIILLLCKRRQIFIDFIPKKP